MDAKTAPNPSNAVYNKNTLKTAIQNATDKTTLDVAITNEKLAFAQANALNTLKVDGSTAPEASEAYSFAPTYSKANFESRITTATSVTDVDIAKTAASVAYNSAFDSKKTKLKQEFNDTPYGNWRKFAAAEAVDALNPSDKLPQDLYSVRDTQGDNYVSALTSHCNNAKNREITTNSKKLKKRCGLCKDDTIYRESGTYSQDVNGSSSTKDPQGQTQKCTNDYIGANATFKIRAYMKPDAQHTDQSRSGGTAGKGRYNYLYAHGDGSHMAANKLRNQGTEFYLTRNGTAYAMHVKGGHRIYDMRSGGLGQRSGSVNSAGGKTGDFTFEPYSPAETMSFENFLKSNRKEWKGWWRRKTAVTAVSHAEDQAIYIGAHGWRHTEQVHATAVGPNKTPSPPCSNPPCHDESKRTVNAYHGWLNLTSANASGAGRNATGGWARPWGFPGAGRWDAAVWMFEKTGNTTDFGLA